MLEFSYSRVMFSFLFKISSTFWFPCTRDFLHVIGALTPWGLHTGSLGFAAKVTKEKTVSVSRADLHLFLWRKCWDGIQIRKGWKLFHKALMSEFSPLTSMQSFKCGVKAGADYACKHTYIFHWHICANCILYSYKFKISVQIAA